VDLKLLRYQFLGVVVSQVREKVNMTFTTYIKESQLYTLFIF
jgi:hypothetical protein